MWYLHVTIRHPLDSETGPSERMRIKRIVEEWRILLPYLVLLHGFLLLDLIGIFSYKFKDFGVRIGGFQNMANPKESWLKWDC